MTRVWNLRSAAPVLSARSATACAMTALSRKASTNCSAPTAWRWSPKDTLKVRLPTLQKKKWDWPLQIIDFDMINRILNKIVLDVSNKFENLIFFIKFWPNKIQKAIWTRLNCWIRTAATSTVCSTFIATWKTKSFANIKSWGIDPMIIY